MDEFAEANLSYRLTQAEVAIEKHRRDLYEGNGKPALTVRLNDLESQVVCNGRPSLSVRLNSLEEDMADRQKREDRTHAYVMSCFFLLLATLFTLIGNLVSKHL